MGGHRRRIHVRLLYIKGAYVLGKILHTILKAYEARGGSDYSGPSALNDPENENNPIDDTIQRVQDALEEFMMDGLIGPDQTEAQELQEPDPEEPAKLPNALITRTGWACPIDGDPFSHLHMIEWFHYPGQTRFPLVMLWKPEEE
jgi:hypothetical protein